MLTEVVPAMPAHSVRPPRGFTLVETMATIAVLGILASIASHVLVESVGRCLDAMTAAQIHSELSVAMDRITREIRRINLDGGAGGVAPDINAVETDTLTWEDLDDDDYEVAFGGGTLTLQVDGGAPAVLLTDVTACTIATFDEDNAPLGASLAGAACDDIRRVSVSVTVTRGGVSETLRTKVFIRATMEGDQ
jgi:prepilin-type N-terminal cleavage/methylation domain-containing protein